MSAPAWWSSITIPYPFPLREGMVVQVELPADLTADEAERVAAFVRSLACDDEAVQA